MRRLIFLFPRMAIQSGGHIAQWRFQEVFRDITPTQTATYQHRVEGYPFLDDLLKVPPNEDDIFIIHWGPNVPSLLSRLRDRNVVYVAHSTGWGFQLPPEVPVITVSRHTQAFWGREAPNQFIMRLPNVIGDEYRPKGLERDIDVLIQKRKSSAYLLDTLAPALAGKCQVKILDEWVDDLSLYFNRAKVYLYDSTDHWESMNASEGFGLPPLEAMACGCTVFSSVNDSLSDYLDPGFNCYKLRTYSTAFDRARILSAVESFVPSDPEALVQEYRQAAVRERALVVLAELNQFFDHLSNTPSDLPLRETGAPEPTGFSRLRSSTRSTLTGIARRFR